MRCHCCARYCLLSSLRSVFHWVSRLSQARSKSRICSRSTCHGDERGLFHTTLHCLLSTWVSWLAGVPASVITGDSRRTWNIGRMGTGAVSPRAQYTTYWYRYLPGRYCWTGLMGLSLLRCKQEVLSAYSNDKPKINACLAYDACSHSRLICCAA